MSNGLLAEWRRGIVARGVAGAALLAVPVAVAAFIGFGSSLSGVVGGLTEIATGPDRTPAAQVGPGALTPAQVALTTAPGGAGAGGRNGGGNGGRGGVGGGGTGVGGSSGGGGSNSGSPAGNTPPVNPPSVNDTGVGSTVNGITDSVSGLLGGH